MGHLQDAFNDLKGENFRILLYHSISNEERYPYSVSEKEFAWQMEWLHRRGVQVLTLEQALRGGCRGGCPRVVLSFDDGYLDNYRTAVPIMEKYGFRAVIFVVSAFVGESNVWEDPALPRLPLMDWEQLRELSERGHIIGGHTHRHIDLAEAPPEKAEKDLAEMKMLLSSQLNGAFLPFAYPFGKYREGIIDLIKRQGYGCAVTAGGFWGNGPRADRWLLRREDIHRGIGRRDFMARVLGARDPRYIFAGLKYITGA